MKKQKFWQSGQTLIELVLAFGVSIMVLSAIVIGVTTSLSNTTYTKNQNLANFYAQEGMAVVRQIRDSSWPTFSSHRLNKYCIGPNSTDLTPASLTFPCRQGELLVAKVFAREVELVHNEGLCNGGSKVTVRVSWTDNKCPAGTNTPLCHKVELVTCFSKLDQKQEP